MSRLTMGILGAIALSLASGAAQFALGRDMGPVPLGLTDGVMSVTAAKRERHQSPQRQFTRALVANRAAKSDRASPPGPAARTKTVSLQADGFSDTSFLLRLPDAQGAAWRTPARLGVRKAMV